MTIRRWVAVAAAASLLLGGGVAAAASRPAPTPAEQAKIFARMLTRADVPKSLMVSPGIEYTVKAHGGQHQALCDKNGKDIQGRETDLLYQVELGETNVETDPIAIEQKVWPYASTQQAPLCTGRSDWRGESGGTNVQYLQNGRTRLTVDGRSGIWIWIDSRKRATNSDNEDGGYYVLYLVKDTIQSVEYDYPDAKGLPFTARAQIDQLAWRLAERWLDTY